MTEVGLCRRLRAWAEALGFVAYPEVAGWDLVLVAEVGMSFEENDGVELCVGDQVGIHAKLRANCEVLVQAMDTGGRHPDYPLVAVPVAGESFRCVARRLGIGVITTEPRKEKRRIWMQPVATNEPAQPVIQYWPPRSRRRDRERLPLPAIASKHIAAGAPSPRVLSPWREKALRFLAFARGRETVTARELIGFGLHRQWVDRWLDPVEGPDGTIIGRDKAGRQQRVQLYRLTENRSELPDAGYEDVAAELAAADVAAAKGAGT